MDKVTSTAPKRIWLQVSDDETDCREPFPVPNESMTWCEDSVLACQVEYVRADIALENIGAANAFEWLAQRLIAADFSWGEDRESVLIFKWPDNCAVSASLRDCIERARLAEAMDGRKDKTQCET